MNGMHENLLMAFCVCDKINDVERRLIEKYQPPLNIKGCALSPERVALSGLRGAMRELALIG